MNNIEVTADSKGFDLHRVSDGNSEFWQIKLLRAVSHHAIWQV